MTKVKPKALNRKVKKSTSVTQRASSKLLLENIENGNEEFLINAFKKKIDRRVLDKTLSSLMERCAHAGQISPRYPQDVTKKYAEQLLIAGADPNVTIKVNKKFPHFEIHTEYDPRHMMMRANGFNFPLVTFCILFERFDILHVLLDRKPHVSFPFEHCPIKALLMYGDPIFHNSVFGQGANQFKSFIEKDVFVSTMKKLLDYGAAKGKEMNNVWLSMALKGRYKSIELLETLLPYCDPLNVPEYTFVHTDPLLFALMDHLYDKEVKIDDILKIVARLLDLGCDINHVRHGGLSPLLRASKAKLGEIVAFLIKSGASLTIKDVAEYQNSLHANKHGDFALHFLCKTFNFTSSRIDMKFSDVTVGIRSLLDAGMSINITNKLQMTPLHSALICSSVQGMFEGGVEFAIRALIQENCDINVPINLDEVVNVGYKESYFDEPGNVLGAIRDKEFHNLSLPTNLKSASPCDITLLFGNLQAFYMLITAGAKYNSSQYEAALSEWKSMTYQGKEMQFESEDDKIAFSKYLQLVEDYVSKPPSLQLLACFKVRASIGKELRKNVMSLPIPALVKENLLLPHLNAVKAIKFKRIRHRYEEEDYEENAEEENNVDENNDGESFEDHYDKKYGGLNYGQYCGILREWSPSLKL